MLKKKPSRTRKVFSIIAVLLAGIIIGTVAFGYIYFTQDSDGEGYGIIPPIGNEAAKLDKRVSVLLIGADKRPGETAYNADTLIVASVDPDTNIISLLSIPRDTRVTIGSNPFLKINSAVLHRGVPELVKQVEELTGIDLDGYVVTNFDGFKGIIDTLGGIDIYVEKRMGPFYTGDKVDGLIDLQQGDTRMTGSLALQYARWRNDAMADIGRTARQQKVLKAVAKEALQPSTIAKLPKLIPQVMDMIETDLKLSDMLKLAKAAAYFDSSNIVSMTLPGAGLYFDNISFWEVNKEMAKKIVKNLLMGITSDKVIDNMVIDLLDPDIKSHITVPGSSKDPNGTDSPGHSVPLDQDGDGEADSGYNQNGDTPPVSEGNEEENTSSEGNEANLPGEISEEPTKDGTEETSDVEQPDSSDSTVGNNDGDNRKPDNYTSDADILILIN